MFTTLLSLIGFALVSVDGYEVKQCQYRAFDSDSHIVLTTYVPKFEDCMEVIEL